MSKNEKNNVAEAESLCRRFNYSTPIGNICIEDNGNAITAVTLDKNSSIVNNNEKESPLARLAFKQLDEYFKGERKKFDLPLCPKGTDFQKRVWKELLKIPYGEVCSYSDIAERIGSPKSCRAVGGANNKNPILIIVPCHRVIGKNGSLVGYGEGLDVKEFLLNLEKSQGK